MNSINHYQNASLVRRVGGIIYDFFLSISFIAVIAALTLFILQANGLKNIQPDSTLSQVLFLYYLFLGFGFFSWFWTHGGQTLGMKAWKLKVLRLDNHPITFWDALARFGLALCLPVISQLWCLIDKQGLALHDRFSGTKLIYIPS
jgi:uncharacterized RDD family membrane protein YckC